MDYVGGDIKIVQKDSAAQCQLLCQQTRDCRAFTYIPNSYNGKHGDAAKRKCHLKNANFVQHTNQEGLVSGPKFCFGNVI